MPYNAQTLWTFRTRRFAVKWEISPDYDCDFSFDETGETAENVASGKWRCFTSHVTVELDGRVVGEDWLGGSIYEKPSEFRDHIGMNKRGHGSYFSDMVREAIREARKALANAPKLRAA